MKCSNCGRVLTDPTSIAAGIGPVCAHKFAKENCMKDDEFTDGELLSDMEKGIILQRIGDRVWTNVPHVVTHHSPTGFEFGYAGSGPADLALNIVEIILRRQGFTGERCKCWRGDCFTLTFELHQSFKKHFIAAVDRNGGVIDYALGAAWVAERVLARQDELPWEGEGHAN